LTSSLLRGHALMLQHNMEADIIDDLMNESGSLDSVRQSPSIG
jgi:hypothetical protein